MDKKLLDRYFEKQCSATEIKVVEKWILDPENRTEFDNFLVTRWSSHVDRHIDVSIADTAKSGSIKWWASAAAAVIMVVGVYYYNIQPQKTEQSAMIAAVPQIKDADHDVKISMDTFHSKMNSKITIHHERKTNTNKPIQILAETDTAKQEEKPLFVKSTKLQNFMVNKVALGKLLHDIDSNHVVLLNFDVHEITFQRLAVLLREECGVVLEPCNGAGTSKTYTARFEAISLPDLLNDMSEKMMFSYSVKDKKVKICFN